jgi:hypothetical protein
MLETRVYAPNTLVLDTCLLLIEPLYVHALESTEEKSHCFQGFQYGCIRKYITTHALVNLIHNWSKATKAQVPTSELYH